MKLLKELSDKDVVGKDIDFIGEWRFRKAVRALVFDGDKIAILNSRTFNFHKLPGGGVEEDEDILLALEREIDEEVGVDIEVGKEVGIVLEHRNEYGLNHESHCYLAKIKGESRDQKLTEWETDYYDLELKWVTIDEAIELLESDYTDNYSGKFILKRDLVFLKEAKKLV